ncbi:MAG: hypothetical protein JO086_17600 [Acidimicrobiia bacterium]|nr:hypothetical protein [Acidimicrobiia bacterium]
MKRVAVCAAIAAVVLAACGGGGGKKAAANKTTTSVSDTSTTAGASTTTTTAAGATATTNKAATATTAAAKVNGQSASNYTPPAGATPAKPAPPGTYHYDTSGSSSLGTQTSSPPPVTPFVVDPPNGTQQHSFRDERDASGKGSTTDTWFDFKPAGVYLDEIKVVSSSPFGPQTIDFKANPPALAAPTGVKPGQSVEFDLSDPNFGANIHVHIDFVRTETITIGGQSVDTMVIHQVGTLSGKVTGTQTSDSWVSPQYDLFVKDHTVADISAYGIKAHSDITSTLQKLTPG